MCVIICTTPLQMLIAYKLINFKIKRRTDIVILANHWNSKYNYYVEILKENSHVSEVYVIKRREGDSVFTKINSKIVNFNDVRKWCVGKSYCVAYFASIDNVYIHFILTKCGIEDVYTFDDGTMNIVETSDYFLNKDTLFNKAIRVFFNLKWDLIRIKIKTIRHYTIYHGIENIVQNTENIHLFQLCNNENIGKYDDSVDIYIGQPFRNKASSVNIYKKLRNKNKNIKYYIHPREDISFIMSQLPMESVLQSNLIIEDYVILFLKQGRKVNLFTVSSSAGLNLYSLENVMVYFILDKALVDEVGGVFNLIKRKSLRTIDI